MFQLTVEREFAAAHAIRIGDHLEPTHGHNWRVIAVVRGGSLDSNGLLVDFHSIERDLDAIIAPFHNNFLNEVEPFDRTNPTAEHVAEHIGRALAGMLPRGVTLRSLSVTEAPGCTATWIVDH